MSTSPPQDGFFLTAPWERHAWTYLCWPSDPALTEEVSALHAALSQRETVLSIRQPGGAAVVAPGQRVRGPDIATDTGRIRDVAPAFVVDGRGGVAGVQFRHTGWGGRVAQTGHDVRFAHALCGEAEVRRFAASLALEHGAYSCDGRGTFLVLADAVLNADRNPGLEKATAFAALHRWLGAERVIWVEESASAGDVTGSDLHRLCRFVARGVVAVCGTDPEKSARITAALAGRKDAGGHPLSIVELPGPEVPDLPGASYASLIFAGNTVLLPSYGARDAAARRVLAGVLPDWDIDFVPARALCRAGLSPDQIVVSQPARVWRSDKVDKLPPSARMPGGASPEEMMALYVNRLADGSE